MTDRVHEIYEMAVDDRPSFWRLGQAVFNYAYDAFPDQADKLRGTEKDCYYRDDKVNEFLNALSDLMTDDL